MNFHVCQISRPLSWTYRPEVLNSATDGYGKMQFRWKTTHHARRKINKTRTIAVSSNAKFNLVTLPRTDSMSENHVMDE